MTWVANTNDSELLTAGILYVGTRDFPYGVYDITIWENSSSTNLNPLSVFRTVHMGLMTLSARASNPTVTWNEYEQDQQQKVYLTNEYV